MNENNNGLKIFNKYIISHVDGTPLKGKSYFVLRLDSDGEEKKAVDAAMKAYFESKGLLYEEDEA